LELLFVHSFASDATSLAMPAGETAERPYMWCVIETPTDGNADYTHPGAPTPTPIQLSQTSHDN